jgi:hypothetical protein
MRTRSFCSCFWVGATAETDWSRAQPIPGRDVAANIFTAKRAKRIVSVRSMSVDLMFITSEVRVGTAATAIFQFSFCSSEEIILYCAFCNPQKKFLPITRASIENCRRWCTNVLQDSYLIHGTALAAQQQHSSSAKEQIRMFCRYRFLRKRIINRAAVAQVERLVAQRLRETERPTLLEPHIAGNSCMVLGYNTTRTAALWF